MVCSYTPTQKERLERYGYRFIRIFGNVFLVRNYSTNAREFSLYGIAVLRKGDCQ
jgi:hypothetical protein